MTRDDIIRMAREARLHLYVNDLTEEPYALIVERFAALVAAAERKPSICRECAKYEARTFELERALRDAAYHCHEIHKNGGTAWDCWYTLQARSRK